MSSMITLICNSATFMTRLVEHDSTTSKNYTVSTTESVCFGNCSYSLNSLFFSDSSCKVQLHIFFPKNFSGISSSSSGSIIGAES